MSESSLSLDFNELQKIVGRFLGMGDNLSAFCPEESARIGRIIETALRRFYFPPITPGQMSSHEWSFLKPKARLGTVADVAVYDLPDDFGGIYGKLTFVDPTNCTWEIQLTGEARIRALASFLPTTTGRPQLVAIRPKPLDGTRGQRYEAIFSPTPDDQYTVDYRYLVLPQTLDTTRRYPYGGAAHADTIMESCLAAAEQLENDEPGMHTQLYMQLLTASVQRDRQLSAADNLGYNYDRSGERGFGWDRRDFMQDTTYNGVLYTG